MKVTKQKTAIIEQIAAADPETRGLHTFHRDAEQTIMDRLASKLDGTASPERIAWERSHPASLETRKEFERAFALRNGEKPKADVVGFYDPIERSAHVRVEKNDDIPGTIAHEHIHGLVSPEAGMTLPVKFVEGAVEDYARKITEHEPQVGDLAAYEEEVLMIRVLEKQGGTDAVERALFKGDKEALRRAVDDALRGNT